MQDYSHYLEKLPKLLPLLKTSHFIVMPKCTYTIMLTPKNKNIIEEAQKHNGYLAVLVNIPNVNGSQNLCKVGTLLHIKHINELTENTMIIVEGICRMQITQHIKQNVGCGYVYVDYNYYQHDLEISVKILDFDTIDVTFLKYFLYFLSSMHLENEFERVKGASLDKFINSLSMMMPISIAEKQLLLEAQTVEEREKLLSFMLASNNVELHSMMV
jgi:Lon protease-like protein